MSYPIDSVLRQLKSAVEESTAVVLQAPPGAGKTTRVPLALLDIFTPEKGRIIMLEPRRIAAVSAARWMAKLLGEDIGKTVGYTIRFERKVSSSTRIEVVTEGVLARRMQSDPGLEGVAAVIFDEFHERSIHSDLSLALCLDIQRSIREDLKIIVMSATLESGPIAALMGNAPVITSEGRAFPVEEHYLEEIKEERLKDRVFNAVGVALNKTSGDILVFLPGAGEIHACAEALKSLRQATDGRLDVRPLYGDLPFDKQEEAILPTGKRKVVLSTNIAETSLTVEGISVVIDSGLTRRQRYNPLTGMNSLITTGVSRASAEQRKGRAGRLGPGVCYRLYSRYALSSMLPFTLPEILTSDLSPLLLQLKVWGVNDPSSLSWLDPPPQAALESAGQLLTGLGALNDKGSPTETGRAMAQLPLHPRLGRLLIRAEELDCTGLGCDLAALISERDIIRKGDDYRSMEADIIERVEMLHQWRKGERSDVRIDVWAMRTADRTSRQLHRLQGSGRSDDSMIDKTVDAENLVRLLLCAYPDRVAALRLEGDGRYLISNGRGVRIDRHSMLSKARYLVAVNVDYGENSEGSVHLACEADERLIREELKPGIKATRRIEWDKRDGKISASVEETLGAVVLSSRPFAPADEEVIPLLCQVIKSSPELISVTDSLRQLQGRVKLIRKAFPEEDLPDLSDEVIFSAPEQWLSVWLKGARNSRDLACLDIMRALESRLEWRQMRLLDDLAPTHIYVPSGSKIAIDYSSGGIPILSVKLQEMFGLEDTPTIARGRIKLMLHLLSPARRPVQVTQDLAGFWRSGYSAVRKELRGRYPKHPWPEDPYSAVATRRTKKGAERERR